MTRQETRQQERQLRPSPKAPGRGSSTPCTWVDRPRKQRRGHRPSHSQGIHTRILSKVPAVTAPQRVPARGLLTVTEHHGQQRASKATTRGKGLGSTPPSRPVAPLTRPLLIIQAVRNFPRDNRPARKQVDQASRGTVCKMVDNAVPSMKLEQANGAKRRVNVKAHVTPPPMLPSSVNRQGLQQKQTQHRNRNMTGRCPAASCAWLWPRSSVH